MKIIITYSNKNFKVRYFLALNGLIYSFKMHAFRDVILPLYRSILRHNPLAASATETDNSVSSSTIYFASWGFPCFILFLIIDLYSWHSFFACVSCICCTIKWFYSFLSVFVKILDGGFNTILSKEASFYYPIISIKRNSTSWIFQCP